MTQPSLDEILTELFMADSNHGANEDLVARAKQAITAYMLAEFMELIGEDENDTREDGEIMRDAVMRNRLREELRTAAQRKYGGTA